MLFFVLRYFDNVMLLMETFGVNHARVKKLRLAADKSRAIGSSMQKVWSLSQPAQVTDLVMKGNQKHKNKVFSSLVDLKE